MHRYKVLAASGERGPKLKRGDKQVPEGVYGISLLNPNSRYHVSLRVNYPNAFDRKMTASDGRKDLGGVQTEVEAKLAARVCKRLAVKGGQTLTIEEQRALLNDLESCNSPRTCPHGRPTMIHLSVDALEKQFGRKGPR